MSIIENYNDIELNALKKIAVTVDQEIRETSLSDNKMGNIPLIHVLHKAKNIFKSIRKKDLSKDHIMLVAILNMIKELLFQVRDIEMKYTMTAFLKKYPDFSKRDDYEQELLLQTANWMHILFEIVSARNAKGLAITVMSKFLGKVN